MKKSKNNISDWLNKHKNPEIDKLVEQQAKQIMTENNIEYQYLDLLQDILDNGVEKETRNGKTISVFGRQLRHKMSEGFPALTTKKFAFKTMTTELLWFLRGDTNIKYLVDNNCHIWDGDAYKSYCNSFRIPGDPNGKTLGEQLDSVKPIEHNPETFIGQIKTDDEFAKQWGELGPIYGAQWRNCNGRKTDGFYEYEANGYSENIKGIDQIQNSINLLKTDPDSRRNRVDAWNVGEVKNQVVPPCHTDFQFYTRGFSKDERMDYWFKNNKPNRHVCDSVYELTEKEQHKYFDDTNVPKRAISLMFNMRSNDVPLGLPFNIASYGLLLEIFGKMVNMVPDELITNLGDAHIYKNQIDGVKKQLTREPYELPKLTHMKTDDFYKTLSNDLSLVSHLNKTDFVLENYQSHSKIDIPLSN